MYMYVEYMFKECKVLFKGLIIMSSLECIAAYTCKMEP